MFDPNQISSDRDMIIHSSKQLCQNTELAFWSASFENDALTTTLPCLYKLNRTSQMELEHNYGIANPNSKVLFWAVKMSYITRIRTGSKLSNLAQNSF